MNSDLKTRPQLVIIGNGMATNRLLEHLLKQAPDHYQITLFGAEPHPAYNRIMLSPVLANEIASDAIQLHNHRWYRLQGIRFFCGETVVRIDRAQRCVYSHSGICQPYDQLVIATGSQPVLPTSVARSSLDGFFSFRTLNDVRQLQQATHSIRHALVIGGGLLGLEAAHGLNQLGCKVTVLHRSNWLLNRQLDPTAGQLLADTLRQRGIEILTGVEAHSFAGQQQVSSVRLSNGCHMPVELVVSAVGIQPDTGLAHAAGLECQRGIVVNNQLLTSDTAIFALGECSEFEGHTFGLVAPVYDQAQVLAAQLTGNTDAAFQHRPLATRLKVSGIELFSAGEHLASPDLQCQQFYNHLDGSYRSLLFRDNRLAGVVLYGDTRDGNHYFELIEQQHDISALRPLLIFGQGVAANTESSLSTATPA